VIASRVGYENPAHPLDAESPASGVDKGEAFAPRSVVDQRFRGLAQDLASVPSGSGTLRRVSMTVRVAIGPSRSSSATK
jgi:hypothetical protein